MEWRSKVEGQQRHFVRVYIPWCNSGVMYCLSLFLITLACFYVRLKVNLEPAQELGRVVVTDVIYLASFYVSSKDIL